MSLAHRFYLQNFEGQRPPKITQIITFMIQSGQYIFSSIWTKRNAKIELIKSELLWKSVFEYNDMNASEISNIMFGVTDPGDDTYGSFNFHEAQAFVMEEQYEENGHLKEKNMEEGTWELDSNPAPNFMPLKNMSRHDQIQMEQKRLQKSPIRHVSSWTKQWLQEKRKTQQPLSDSTLRKESPPVDKDED